MDGQKLDIIKTLKEVLGLGEGIFNSGFSPEEMLSRMEEVQSMVIELGNALDSFPERGIHSVVCQMELYCEILYRLHEDLRLESIVRNDAVRALNRVASRIVCKCFERLFPDRDDMTRSSLAEAKKMESDVLWLMKDLVKYHGLMEKLESCGNVYIYEEDVESIIMNRLLREEGLRNLRGFVSPGDDHEIKGEGTVSCLEDAKLSAGDVVLFPSASYMRGYDMEYAAGHTGSQLMPINYFDERKPDYYEQVPPQAWPSELKWWFEGATEEKLDLDNPRTYNAKLQWMKLYDMDPRKEILADKYRVRDWVREKIGEEHLIPLLGVYSSFDEIDFDALPDAFALKCNHGSGFNLIVNNKAELDLKKEKEKFDHWMGVNFAFLCYELHYRNIKPLIVAEELLREENGDEIRDYKVFVFGGKARFIQVDCDRFSNHRQNLYTTDWEYMDCSVAYGSDPDRQVEKPSCLSELVRLAEVLGEGFAHVRVDFYIVGERIYFGEMTFTHWGGCARIVPPEFAYTMGDWIDLGMCVTD